MMGDPSQLQLIQLLLKATGAKKYLDIGVFTGCSVLAAALALPPDGKVVGLDDCKEYVDIGRPFWKEAGVEHKIDIRIGNALEILDCAIADGQANTFDFVFIDADKKSYDDYYERCLQLVRRNGLIAFDNVLWDGKVYDAEDKSPDTVAIRRMNEKLHKDTRVDISMLTVGDGLTLALRK
uniref:Putative o-methyltransferase n=1 Tax=Ixodes ricinus TaxID=34613 RepID=V5HW44_IXORI